jgi:hypothetical protein
MLEKIINHKYFVAIFLAVIFIESKEFVISSINKFYLFQIEKTERTKGIITKALLHDGMGARTFECSFSYKMNGLLVNNRETISVDSATNFKQGDSVKIVYNIKQPFKGTIDNIKDRIFRFIASISILAGTGYAGFILCQMIYFKIRKRNNIN